MIITVFRSDYSNWSYKLISMYKKRTKSQMVIVSFETLNMAEQFTIESLPVHLITQYAIQGLVEPVRTWMKKTGLTDPPQKANPLRRQNPFRRQTPPQKADLPSEGRPSLRRQTLPQKADPPSEGRPPLSRQTSPQKVDPPSEGRPSLRR